MPLDVVHTVNSAVSSVGMDLQPIKDNLDGSCSAPYLKSDCSAMLIEIRWLRDFSESMRQERNHALMQRDDILQLLRDIARPVCVVCDCMLVGLVDVDSDRPPHCHDCMGDDELEWKWENETRPEILRRIKLALG